MRVIGRDVNGETSVLDGQTSLITFDSLCFLSKYQL